jgi:hypothetical protein
MNLGARPPVFAETPVKGGLRLPGCGGAEVGVEEEGAGGEEEEEEERGEEETDGVGTEGAEEEDGTINLGKAREE